MAKASIPEECPACKGPLERGYAFGGTAVRASVFWVPTPVRAGAEGVAPTAAGWARRRAMEVWRCEDCGRVEVYAPFRPGGR